MRTWMIAPLALAALAAGCGETTTQRAATGGVSGLALGAAVGGPIGALVGAGVGAGGGMYRETIEQASDPAVDRITTQARAQLQGEEAPAASTASAPQRPAASGMAQQARAADLTNQEVREAQTALKNMGLYEGDVDGLYGRRTISAVREFQTKEDLRQTGALDQQTKQKLQVAAGEGGRPEGQQGRPATGAEQPSGGAATDEPRSRPEGGGDSGQTAEEPRPATPANP